jgi:HAD superfamily hydrolase (TIGR01509 family)
MGVPPDRCLVFEDSVTGLDAARAANMLSVFVPAPIRA